MINGAASQSNITCTDLTWPIALKTEQSKEEFLRLIQRIEIMASRVVTWITKLEHFLYDDVAQICKRGLFWLCHTSVFTYRFYKPTLHRIHYHYQSNLIPQESTFGSRKKEVDPFVKNRSANIQTKVVVVFPSRYVLITQMCAVFRLTWCWISVHLRTYIHSRL